VLLLVAAIGCAIPPIRHARLEHRLTAAVQELAGPETEVHCATAGEAAFDAGQELGLVRFTATGPERTAVLKHGPCTELSHWLSDDAKDGAEPPDPARRKQLIAVHVLTHEAMHLTGTRDEAQTECQAVQRDAQTAQVLGASAGYARELARWYWREVYPHMPDAYRTPECAPGGRLDEGLPDAPWS